MSRRAFVALLEVKNLSIGFRHGKSVNPVVSEVRLAVGRGEVLAIEGVEPNRKATVRFESAGMKLLLLKFARLKIEE